MNTATVYVSKFPQEILRVGRLLVTFGAANKAHNVTADDN